MVANSEFGNIIVSKNTFIHNTASIRGGGVLFSGGTYINISLTNNTFSYNTAVYWECRTSIHFITAVRL